MESGGSNCLSFALLTALNVGVCHSVPACLHDCTNVCDQP